MQRNRALRAGAGLFAAVLLAGLSQTAEAGSLYRFEDEQGTVHFTDAPSTSNFQRVRFTPMGLVISRPSHETSVSPDRFDPLIARTASRYRVHPGLVKAVIKAESNFDTRAVSHKGALGLMQLMPQTARRMGVENPMRPADNVRGGTRYLKKMIDRYGKLSFALAAYNAGPKAVDRYRGIPPYPETRAYVTRVLDYYRRFDDDFRR